MFERDPILYIANMETTTKQLVDWGRDPTSWEPRVILITERKYITVFKYNLTGGHRYSFFKTQEFPFSQDLLMSSSNIEKCP